MQGISLWNDEQSAQRYHKSTCPQVLEKLSPVIEGTPNVESYNVESYEVALTTVSA